MGSTLFTAPLLFGSFPLWAEALLLAEILLLAVLSQRPLIGGILLPPKPIFFALGLYVVLCFASVVTSVYPAETLRQAFFMLAFAVLFVALYNFFDERGPYCQILYLALGAGVVIALSAYVRQSLQLWPSDRPGLAGPYGNHNHLAGLLELLAPLALTLAVFSLKKTEKNIVRILACSAVFIFFCTTLILTRSRAGIACMFTAFVTVSMFSAFGGVTRHFWRYPAAILALLTLVVVVYEETFRDLLATFQTDHTWLRFELWQSTLAMIRERPLLGHSIGTFPWVSYRFRTPQVGHHVNFAHNDFLQAFAELGVGGFLAALMLGFYTPWQILKLTRGHRRSSTIAIGIGAATGLLSLALHGLYDFNYHIPANFYFSIVVAACALRVVDSQPRQWLLATPSKRMARFLWLASGVGAMLTAAAMVALLWLAAADGLFERAQYREKRHLPGALQDFERAAALNPWMAEYQTRVGGQYMQMGRLNDAAHAFERALRLNHALANDHYHLGLIARRQLDFAGAQEHLEAAIVLDPHEISKRKAYYDLLLYTGQADLALLSARELLNQNPGMLEAILPVFEAAKLPIDRVAVMLPPDPLTHLYFAQQIAKRADAATLEHWARRVAHEMPPLPQTYALLTRALRAKNLQAEALFTAQQGLLRFPFDAELTQLYGDLCLSRGDGEAARTAYLGVLLAQSSPKAETLDRFLETFYARQHEVEAEKFLQDLLRERPKSTVIREKLGQLYLRTHRWDQVVEVYRELVSKQSRQPRNFEALAIAHTEMGHQAAAAEAWERFLALEPKRTDALFALAKAYEKMQRYDMAQTLYTRILALNPQDAAARTALQSLRRQTR